MRNVVSSFLLSLVCLLLFNIQGALAASTTMGVTPQSGSYGAPFTASLVIDGHGDKFNAAQATVTLSPSLAIKDLVLGDCNFSFLKTPSIQNPSFAGFILSAYATKCTAYTLTLVPKGTTDATGTVRFSSLQAGIYDATVEENNMKVGENIINVSGQNHVLTLGINLKGEQKNPLLKNANPFFKTLSTSPLLIAGIALVGVIAGTVLTIVLTRLKGSGKIPAKIPA